MTEIKTFRDLIAWQKAMELTCLIYAATEAMPRNEQFGLTNQLRRAAVSVPSNIAEGYARQSLPDYMKYLRIARASLAEISTQWELTQRMKMIKDNPQTTALIAEVDRIIQGLLRKLEEKKSDK